MIMSRMQAWQTLPTTCQDLYNMQNHDQSLYGCDNDRKQLDKILASTIMQDQNDNGF